MYVLIDWSRQQAEYIYIFFKFLIYYFVCLYKILGLSITLYAVYSMLTCWTFKLGQFACAGSNKSLPFLHPRLILSSLE